MSIPRQCVVGDDDIREGMSLGEVEGILLCLKGKEVGNLVGKDDDRFDGELNGMLDDFIEGLGVGVKVC